jgi:5-formyltetrahydrofolate cyclo-ligase
MTGLEPVIHRPAAMLSKTELRKLAREKRKNFSHPDIGAALASHAALLKLPPGAVVGGYHALPHEADPALLLQVLVAQGCHIAFPRIVVRDLPLEFHLVPDGEVLKPGTFGVHEPEAHWPSVMPHLLLVPLLAFDKQGHRLGYGGGFYDRTLHAYRSGAPSLRAIGVGYAAQELENIPAEPHDMALDGILTENGLVFIR